MRVTDLSTPAPLVDADALEHNIATMSKAWPGPRLRPHVKAFKSTALARELVAAGHSAFCAATVREIVGMAVAGLGDDLLLANEVLDPRRLATLAELGGSRSARVTVAVDSDATIDAAAVAGIREVLVDVAVGLPRCGCDPSDARRLGELARSRSLQVRGVMGYEGHVVAMEDRQDRESGVAESMAILTTAHADVGGEVVSGGGTGTWDCNTWLTELQAGSYLLMDTTYAKLGLPFRSALSVLGTVISVSRAGFAVADVGVKALGMDHGNPSIDGQVVWYCSDEHIVFSPDEDGTGTLPRVGEQVHVRPAHVDPTVACHDTLHLVRDDEVIESWPIDLRGW